MRLFIDSANIEEIRTAQSWGILAGVTTNPSLIAKECKPFKERALQICGMFPKDAFVSLEVVGTKAEEMVKQGRELSGWAPNVVVKIPATEEGLKALSVLSREKIRVNCTVVFSAAQAILAAISGATFVSPFLGRLNTRGGNSLELLRDIVVVYKLHAVSTQVLAASIKNPRDVIEAFKTGADIVTAPFSVLREMIVHPMSAEDLATFLEDWKKCPGSDKVFT